MWCNYAPFYYKFKELHQLLSFRKIYAEIHENTSPDSVCAVGIHGVMLDHHLMSSWLHPILSSYRLFEEIYPDLPGMGKTAADGFPDTSDGIADVLAYFIRRHAQGRPVLLIGHSFGGYLASRLSGLLADQLVGQIYICPVTVPYREDRKMPEDLTPESSYIPPEPVSAGELALYENAFIVRNAATWQIFRRLVLPAVQICDRDYLKKLQSKGHYELHQQPGVSEKCVESPSLYLLGKKDNTAGWENAIAFASQSAASAICIAEHAGHLLPSESPDIFTAAVQDFLNLIRAPHQAPS